MKNIFQKIILVMIAVIGFASFDVSHASAATFANDGSYGSVVLVSNYTQNPGCSTCWSTSVSAQPGDVVSVLVYYHNTGNDGAINTRVFINPFSGSQSSFSVSGGVSASNANTLTGSSTINISSSQTLTYIAGSTKWYKDQTVQTGLLNGQSGAEIIGGGLSLGTIEGNNTCPLSNTYCHQGTVVARFQVSQQQQQTYACNDGQDNDLDNKVDMNDPGCTSTTDNDEYDYVQQGQAPSATTTSATNITQTTATINGNFNSNGANTYTHFEWGTSYGSLINQTIAINQILGSGLTQAYLSNLSAGTTYYYKLCAVNPYGTVCGSTLSFTTIYQQSFACNDNIDNDNDGRIDYPNDSGCTSIYDNDEYNYIQPTVYACNDGYDNDNDGKVDMNDPGCTSSYDNDEYNYVQPTTYACNDGYDNDNDGKVDMSDPGCTSYYDTDEYNYVQQNGPSVATLLASSINSNSGKLNGTIVNNSSSNATVWFEWGTSYSLGYTTNTQTIGAYNTTYSNSFSDVIYNLAPNTYYYFRAVGQNSYGTSRGDIYYFKTSTVYVPNQVVYINDNTQNSVTGDPLLTLVIDSRYESFGRGDSVDYTVTYTNTSGKITLDDAILHIQFPKHFEFVRSSRGEYSLADNTLTLDIGEIDPLDEDSFYIEGIAKMSAISGDLFATSGTMTYIVPKNIQEEVIAYSLDRITNRNVLGAFALGAGIFPGTLLGWLLIVLIILGIILIIRKIGKKEDKNEMILPGARRIE